MRMITLFLPKSNPTGLLLEQIVPGSKGEKIRGWTSQPTVAPVNTKYGEKTLPGLELLIIGSRLGCVHVNAQSAYHVAVQ
jgi:hypothetical protein